MATPTPDREALRLHAVKNCAATISVLSRLLAMNETPDRRQLERLQATADRMTKLLCASLESRSGALDVSELLQFVKTEVAPAAQQHQVKLEFSSMPASIGGASGDLREALLNLVQNAVEASPPGGHVRVVHRSDGAGAQYFLICDQGPGMREDILRTNGPVRSSKQNGSGLGLVLARHVVEHQGGKLDILPSNRGTTIRVRLPAAA